MRTVLKAVDKFQNAVNNLIAAVMMVIMVIILVQTVGRGISLSIPWSEEASRYLFVTMILLGINIGISQNMMVNIDMIDKFLSKGAKKVMCVIREVIGLAVACMFFYSTFPMIKIGQFQKSPALQLPMSVMYIIMAVGFALAVLATLIRLIRLFTDSDKEEKA